MGALFAEVRKTDPSIHSKFLLDLGLPEDEPRKQARIKAGITAHLKMCIKVLQNEYVKSDTPIHR